MTLGRRTSDGRFINVDTVITGLGRSRSRLRVLLRARRPA